MPAYGAFHEAPLWRRKLGEIAMAFNSGDKVTFTTSWDIFAANVLIPIGATGTVTEYENDAQLLGVKMDIEYPTLGEWQNVVWLDSEIEPFESVITPR
jgi:hypothetical protein